MKLINSDLKSGVLTATLVLWIAVIAGSEGRNALIGCASAKKSEASWRNLITGRVPVMGTPTARFKIVEFSDYQCPFCALADRDLATFVSRHVGDVVVYRYDMPLQDIHHYAYAAAIAANCAEAQGVREPYQSLLFRHQREFAALDWAALGKQAGITNDNSFAQCIQSRTPLDHIRKDVEIGKAMGISGTPSCVVDGEILSGGVSAEKLEAIYRGKQKRQRNIFSRLLGSE